MSWLNLIDRLVHRFKLAHSCDKVNEWFNTHGKTKAQMFLEAPEDKELEELNGYIERIFNRVNDRTSGKFYKAYDWYVERDKSGKLHLHVFEIK